MAKHNQEEKTTLAEAGKTLSRIVKAHKPGSAYWQAMADRITAREHAYGDALVAEALGMEDDEEDPPRDWCGWEDAYGDN